MKKTFLLFSLILFSASSQAQTRIKGNILLLPLGIANVALEAKLNNHVTLQPEFLVSPWKSFFGEHFQIYYTSVEARYYFKESFKGFYLGGNVGLAFFDLKKWNYIDSPKYQRGHNLLIGATLGYQYQINDSWNADFFFGGGNSEGFYHGYYEEDGQRYENSNPWNRSGEWIPFKGGIMISYQLK